MQHVHVHGMSMCDVAASTYKIHAVCTRLRRRCATKQTDRDRHAVLLLVCAHALPSRPTLSTSSRAPWSLRWG